MAWHECFYGYFIEYGGLEPLKIQNEIQGSTMKLTEERNEKKKKQKQREQNSQAQVAGADPHRFPPLRESVRFFIINIFLIIIITIIKELFKLKFGKWSGQMFSFSSFRAFYAPSMDQKPKKGTLGFMSPGSPRSLLPRPLL